MLFIYVWIMLIIMKLNIQSPRSDGVEIVAKGGRSCLHVAQMQENDFGWIFNLF